MDQDAFRKLLSTPKQNGSHNTPSRGSWLSKAKEDQKKTAEASADNSKPGFKPRKVKKQSDFGYRDRAAERRTGVAGDFAEVESVLETFEKQHANEDKEIVEERRKYLGGDSEHTVLVKGLDFALLEQAKARLAASSSTKDDEELEVAFRGAISGSPPALEEALSSKKRTREDIVRELKTKKTKGEANGGDATVPVVDKSIDEAKKEGKFKPIGFKPIGGSNSKAKDGKEVKKKKKRKVEGNAVAAQTATTSSAGAGAKKVDEPSGSNAAQNSDMELPRPVPAPVPEPEPLNEDFDIFAGAGEYEGIDLGDDDDEDDSVDGDSSRERNGGSPSETHSPEVSRQEQAERRDDEQQNLPRPNRRWIEDDEELDKSTSAPPDRRSPINADARGKQKATTPHLDEPPSSEAHPEHEAETDFKPEPITRLAPLASSSVPSIQDILAADAAREAEEKHKARKEKLKSKRGGGGGEGGGEKKKVSAEAKINRDYQKLKSYTAKKGGGL